jgi:hypothetical protein
MQRLRVDQIRAKVANRIDIFQVLYFCRERGGQVIEGFLGAVRQGRNRVERVGLVSKNKDGQGEGYAEGYALTRGAGLQGDAARPERCNVGGVPLPVALV